VIYITDYIENYDLEQNIIGNNLSSFLDTNVNFLEVEVLMVWHFHANKESLKKFPNVKSIIRYGVGFDNIDIEYCKSKSIKVFNNPDYGVDEVSDTALAMIMSLSRCTESYNNQSKQLVIRPNKNKPWQENTNKRSKRLKEMSLGILGVGRIGSALALKMKNIVGEIHFFDPGVVSGYEKVLSATRHTSLKNLLKTSDILSIHAPLTKSTKGLVDENFINNMKDDSILINTARGGILKSHLCLYDGIVSGKLSGIGLDVLPDEPPKLDPEDKLLSLWLENNEEYHGRIIINPHTAYYSEDSYIEMRRKAATYALNALGNNQFINRII